MLNLSRKSDVKMDHGDPIYIYFFFNAKIFTESFQIFQNCYKKQTNTVKLITN